MPDNWISITLDNLKNAKVSALVNALNTAALAEGQASRAPEQIQKAVNKIRNRVEACTTNQVDSDETKIPKELLDIAERLIIWNLKSALEIATTDEEKIDHKNDLDDLEKVALCKLPVSLPDDAVAPETQSPAPIELVDPPTRQATRAKLSGL